MPSRLLGNAELDLLGKTASSVIVLALHHPTGYIRIITLWINTMKVRVCILLAVVLQVVCTLASELQADDWSTYNHEPVKKGRQQRQNNVPFNLCMTDPCENGGTCEPTRGFLYKCVCPRGFAGKNCENEINFCADQPCSNGGTCEIYQDSYRCLCNEGFAGKTCSTRIDHCSGTPCMNGGTCTSTTTGFKCACTADYAGESCEVDIDSCTLSPCRNGATCQDLPTSYNESKKQKRRKTLHLMSARALQYVLHVLIGSSLGVKGRLEVKGRLGVKGRLEVKELDTNFQMDFATPTINDYAKFVIDKPLTDVTVAFWMQTTDEFNQGTPFSYAVKGVPNALTLTDYSNLQHFVNDETVSIGLKLNDGLWHHVALMWSSNKGDWLLYVDGVLRDQAYDLSPSKPIPGNGSFIIGQEQDVMGGQFSSSETFVGSLTQFNVWDGVLSLQEVHKLIYSCEKFEGNVLAWSSVKDAFKGDISISPSTFCKECPTPVNPLHGEVTFNDTKAGAIAVYACNRGYSLDRTETPKCLSMGRYDQITPICSVINCGSPGNIKFGTVKGRDYTVGKKVMFECNYGYKLSGINASVCTESEEWDFEEKPKCVPMTCTLPQVSANTIPSVQDEEVKQGTTVRFTCKPGNNLQTRHNAVVCQKDGTWDRSIPSCDQITCSNPPTIENGEILTTYTQYYIGDSVRYQCDTGFEFRAGISSISCLPTGNWDTVLPVCLSITCPDPPLITNAVSVGTDRTYGAVVNYTCLPGFKSSVPSAQIKCELTKDWSSTRFRCTEVDCGAPAEIPNGIISGDTYVFKNYVLYQCNQGYTLTGPERRVCQENGQWSDTHPVCSPVVCGNLTAVLNGQVVYTAMTYLSTARFACDRGFELRGAQEITCMASGQWVPDPPECVPRSCPTPQDILFGSFTSSVELIFKATVNYTCNTGYILTGTDQLTCLEDGTWSSSPPECTKTTCPQTDDPAHDLNSPRPTVVNAEKPNDKFEQSEKVAFTVGLSKQLDVLLKDVVVYNEVVSNIGDNYNNTNGVFRCNIAGLYFFQIYGAANKGKELSLSLVKNKTKVVSLYSNTNQELSLAANSAVLLLEAGDEVFVEASNCGSLYGEEHHVINTFSGFLLRKAI
ncbi:sushi, von Willebrand factor type A, EGF and pentraxin domain-containing protein 1-like [Physella acuta]|uniref:sushi, von Willebrand factor type A, EGF and pentraxin domain-containing protein 1-like n=1 Tax=Physella acuta TaxID=109671 RepID=UPI0027DD0ED9|nr:sushi, von Willebrand factor type A, EGF and pentraxin domain-containing protein 1-like [Physella acuta]